MPAGYNARDGISQEFIRGIQGLFSGPDVTAKYQNYPDNHQRTMRGGLSTAKNHKSFNEEMGNFNDVLDEAAKNYTGYTADSCSDFKHNLKNTMNEALKHSEALVAAEREISKAQVNFDSSLRKYNNLVHTRSWIPALPTNAVELAFSALPVFLATTFTMISTKTLLDRWYAHNTDADYSGAQLHNSRHCVSCGQQPSNTFQSYNQQRGSGQGPYL